MVTKNLLKTFIAALSQMTWRDRAYWKQKLHYIETLPHQQQQQKLSDYAPAIQNACRFFAQRCASVPSIDYPLTLPITAQIENINAALQKHQVIIIAGETGSGKTTQLPKLCLAAGRGRFGTIGHTQPRRLAARVVAQRIAEELNTPFGQQVGYKVRFNDKTHAKTLIKLMTDGVLLAEISQDSELLQYDTLIIDEAHERSLNIDFLLGYLHQLLPRRPNLKLIITSATIDVQRFSHHFNNAPIITVSGRTYPVEVRYRPVNNEQGDKSKVHAIILAIMELGETSQGDILIFLSGEGDIRETAVALSKQNFPYTTIFPLYARLSQKEQHRIFAPQAGRKIILATNVAETSLTIPGIRYVIDPGCARISRYSYRTKVQQLQIEPISQAAAQQRAGRCGRLADGICIRLYDEQDYLSRPHFTDPEILRTNLAAVMIQLSANKISRDIEKFPFIQPPDKRYIRDAVLLLEALGVTVPRANPMLPLELNEIGKKVAILPLDPKLARIIIAGSAHACLSEVMIIVAALSISDPREYPLDNRQAAEQKHRAFFDPHSDFITFINLWSFLKKEAHSVNQLRQICRRHFLNYLRVREWQEIHTQLIVYAKQLKLKMNDIPADYAAIHCALLTGFIGQIGQKLLLNQEYIGARNIKFILFPTSTLNKKAVKWVMVATLLQMDQLWGCIGARIEPEWVLRVGGHLVQRHYSQPHWKKNRGAVMAKERVTLYGLPLLLGNRVTYSSIDPVLCRALFIRHALVQGEWNGEYAFWKKNQDFLAQLNQLEEKKRRRDMMVSDDMQWQFYDQRLPEQIISIHHFERWWKLTSKNSPNLLDFDYDTFLDSVTSKIDEVAFPDYWQQGENHFPLAYHFSPGEVCDGVTVTLPLMLLPHINPVDFSWQIAGLRAELIAKLLKSLPKQLRRHFSPINYFSEALLSSIKPSAGIALTDALSIELQRITGIKITQSDWQWQQVPEHLKILFSIIDENEQVVASGRDLAAITASFSHQAQLKVAIKNDVEIAKNSNLSLSAPITDWNFGDLVQEKIVNQDGYQIKCYPALVDENSVVTIKLCGTLLAQQQCMWQGLRRLFYCRLNIKPIKSWVNKNVGWATLCNRFSALEMIIEQALLVTIESIMIKNGGIIWRQADFKLLLSEVKAHYEALCIKLFAEIEKILSCYFNLQTRITQKAMNAKENGVILDMQMQLQQLIYPNFIVNSGYKHMYDLLRYLKAIAHRLDKYQSNSSADALKQKAIMMLEQQWRQLPEGEGGEANKHTIFWMLQELRVHLFAQHLGVSHPISEKKVQQAILKAQHN